MGTKPHVTIAAFLQTLSVTALCLAGTVAEAQQAARTVPQSFEVASVRPNPIGGDSRRAGTSPGGVFTAKNVTLRLLISRAYGIAEAQIQGGPGWIGTDTYDISAKADTPLQMTPEELRPCLQALLADRFHLVLHRETKEGSVYSLVLTKDGPKFKEHPGDGSPGISSSSDHGKVDIAGTKITMSRLAEYLSGRAGKPVLDNTGLKGEYDFRVEWSDEASADPSGLSIFTALQEQLGLKLNATRGPIPTIVIDRVEKASAN